MIVGDEVEGIVGLLHGQGRPEHAQVVAQVGGSRRFDARKGAFSAVARGEACTAAHPIPCLPGVMGKGRLLGRVFGGRPRPPAVGAGAAPICKLSMVSAKIKADGRFDFCRRG